jgi:hypothetical protein
VTRSPFGAIHDRDVNAARNIRAAARRTLSGSAGRRSVGGFWVSVLSVVPTGAGPRRAGAVSRFGEADRMRRDRSDATAGSDLELQLATRQDHTNEVYQQVNGCAARDLNPEPAD